MPMCMHILLFLPQLKKIKSFLRINLNFNVLVAKNVTVFAVNKTIIYV